MWSSPLVAEGLLAGPRRVDLDLLSSFPHSTIFPGVSKVVFWCDNREWWPSVSVKARWSAWGLEASSGNPKKLPQCLKKNEHCVCKRSETSLTSVVFSSRVSGRKSESKEAKKSEEPKIRKKPGPKPGWKGKPRCER